MTELSHEPAISINENGNIPKLKPESLSISNSKNMNNSLCDNIPDKLNIETKNHSEDNHDSENLALESDSKPPEFLHDSLSEDSTSLPPDDNQISYNSTSNSDIDLTESLQDTIVEETTGLPSALGNRSKSSFNSDTGPTIKAQDIIAEEAFVQPPKAKTDLNIIASSTVSTSIEASLYNNTADNLDSSILDDKDANENLVLKSDSNNELSHFDATAKDLKALPQSARVSQNLDSASVLSQHDSVFEEPITISEPNHNTESSVLKNETLLYGHSQLDSSKNDNTPSKTNHDCDTPALKPEPTSPSSLQLDIKVEESNSQCNNIRISGDSSLKSDPIRTEKPRLDSLVEEPSTLLPEASHDSKKPTSLISLSSQESQQSEGGLLNKVRDLYMSRTKSDTIPKSTQPSESLNLAAFIQKRVRGLSEITSFQTSSPRTLSVNDSFVKDHNSGNFKLQDIPKHVRRMSLLDVAPPTDTRAASLYSVEEHNADDIDWEFWGQLVNNFPDMLKNQYPVLQKSIRQGIPVSMRGMVWQLIADVRGANLIPVYTNLLTKTSPHEKSISQDLPRTFPNLPFFKNKEGTGQESLFNVLKCYSLYDPEVGYCQGLSFIAGPLLLNMPDEEAFCILVQMMKDLRQHFTPAMEGLQVRTYQFERLMEEKIPKVYQHLQEQGIQSTMYASQWFMTLFAYRSSIRLVFRILDILLLEGSDILVKVALALLQDNIDLILSKRFDELISFLKTGIFDQYEDKIDIIIALACDQNLPTRRMSKWSLEYMTELAKKAEEEAYAASLQGMNKQLIASNKDLSVQIEALINDRQQIAQQLTEAHDKHAAQLEQNEILNRRLNELEVMLHTERQKAEAALQDQMDILAQKNLSLVTKNADLEDALAIAENTILNLKAKLQVQL